MREEMHYLVVSLYLIVLVGGSATEWTLNCPTGCVCRWINGRKTAECRDAGFSSIPVGLSDEVQVLDLRGNTITSLRKHVFRDAGLVNLNRIKMTNCGIERVDRYAFADLMLLVELDLSENRIRELTMESFETNARLRELQISGNPLTQLLGTRFPPLLYFQKLSLRNCNLTTIPARAFEQLTTLEQLDLSGNQFQTLSEDLFRHLQKLKSLALHDNPWKCDCRLKSFRDWSLTNNLLTIQPTKCTQPDRLANFEWSQLLTSHFTCSPEIVALQISGQATDAYIVGDVGKTIRLECLVKGNPPPDVRWVKDTISMTNGTAAATGKSYYVQVSGDIERWVNLTLTNTHLGDAGEYTCVGENKGGSAERNITLNFEDVPSGAGVGMGMGSEGGSLPGTSWLWILIGSLGALLMLSILLGLIFCVCSRRPRKDRRTEIKGMQLQDLLTSGGDTLDSSGSKVNDQKESVVPLLSENRLERSEDPDYPDLLDLPVGIGIRRQESPVGSVVSRSTLPDTTQLVQKQPIYYHPQELNPSALYDPNQARSAITLYSHPYMTPYGRPQSPFSGSVASFGGPEQPRVIIPQNRRGYVTLPRKPRVPSWSPATPLSVSPTGSSTMLLGSPYVKYDNLGQRTTADGSSLQNLNKLDSYPGTPNSYPSSTVPIHPRSRMNGSARLNGSTSTPIPYHPPVPTYFNFDPIQENEGGSGDSYIGLPPVNDGQVNGRLSSMSDGKATPTAKKVPPKPPPKPKKLELDSPLPNPEASTASATFETGDEGTEV